MSRGRAGGGGDAGARRGRAPGRGPVRTCLGCRRRDTQAALLRLVARGDTLVPDPRRRLAGRGAYVHPVPECWRQAERRRPWRKALRLADTPDISVVAGHLALPPGC